MAMHNCPHCICRPEDEVEIQSEFDNICKFCGSKNLIIMDKTTGFLPRTRCLNCNKWQEDPVRLKG